MPSRGRHPKKEVAEAIEYAESRGWRRRAGNGHVWATLYCPHAAPDGCKIRVHSTPQDPGSHAKRIRREVNSCPH
ncbi:MAG TPA: hypothetical protein VFX49_06110 [Chloroflexota bacterium]|nr:hypothetical protein [Chloroflexota bacterium]